MSDKKYWNSFYKEKTYSAEDTHLSDPSSFAIFSKDFLCKDDRVLDVGCGNGRDSLYLKDYCQSLVGIDNSSTSISFLKGYETNNSNLSFVLCDVGDIHTLDNPTVVYTRFFLHSINLDQQTHLFTWLEKLDSNTKLMLECRSDKDVGTRYFKDPHYRRLINYDKLVEEVKNLGYSIDYSLESTGLSPYKEEDPFLIRLRATKND
tara:strand:+ start:1892 stop:2506 length:615 start_codon:yes stop_codon:yes gene_type:complete